VTPMNIDTLLGLVSHGGDAGRLCLLAALALVGFLAGGLTLLGRGRPKPGAPWALGLRDLWRLTGSPSRPSTTPHSRSAGVTQPYPKTGDPT